MWNLLGEVAIAIIVAVVTVLVVAFVLGSDWDD